MDLFYKLFDLFVSAARQLADYIPQSGEDVMRLFGYVLHFAGLANNWLADRLGVDLYRFFVAVGNLLIYSFDYFVGIVKNLAARI